MSILDDIAKGGTARPLAAFLVGREQRRQRERQDRQDQISQLNTESQIRLRDAQTQALTNPAPKPDEFGFKEVKEGEEFVLYQTINGQLGDELARGPRSIVQRQETGPPGSFGTDSQKGAAQIAINTRAGAVNTFGDMAQRQMQIFEDTPGANTLTAKMANVGNRVMNEARAFSSQFGVEFESGPAAFDPANYADTFEAAGLAGQSPRVKNGFLALAIQRAMAAGLGSGRALSDKDIEQQLQTLGRNQADPNIIRQVFDDSMSNLIDSVNNEAQAQGLTVPEIRRPDFGVNVNQRENELGDFQEGQTAVNPATGERIVYRNGKWEPFDG